MFLYSTSFFMYLPILLECLTEDTLLLHMGIMGMQRPGPDVRQGWVGGGK